MRITRIVLAVAFTVFAVAAAAKYEVGSKSRLNFAERWSSVDQAVQSGEFRQR
jgi:hypothetical protein